MSFDIPIFTTSNKTKAKIKSTLTKVCVFCSKKIKELGYVTGTEYNGPLSSYDSIKIDSNANKLIFCDLICAKLYDVNIHKISIDFKSYKDFNNNGKLSKNAVKIYNKCKHKLFSELLILKINDDMNTMDKDAKKEYIKKIRSDYYNCI